VHAAWRGVGAKPLLMPWRGRRRQKRVGVGGLIRTRAVVNEVSATLNLWEGGFHGAASGLRIRARSPCAC
jgi:hypothetical protein